MEDKEQRIVTINLPADVEAVAQQKAAAIGVTVADYVVHLILDDQWLAISESDLALNAAQLDHAMEEARAGRTSPAKETLRAIADEFGLRIDQ